jgi:hypothetical protein
VTAQPPGFALALGEAIRVAYLLGKPRQAAIDRSIRCYALTLERQEHLKINRLCFVTHLKFLHFPERITKWYPRGFRVIMFSGKPESNTRKDTHYPPPTYCHV